MSGKRRNEGEPHGIRLPGSLLDELKGRQNGDDDDSRFNLSKNFENKKRKLNVSRKEKRKEERAAKKQRKSQPKDLKSKKHQQPNKAPSNKKIQNGHQSHKSNGDRPLDDDEDEFKGFDEDNDSSDDAPEEEYGDSDDYEDFDDDLNEEDFEDGSEEEFSEDDEESQPQTAEDTMKALMALKAKKAQKQPSSAEETMALLKAKKSQKQPTTAEETMALLKAKKANKSKSEETMDLLKQQKEEKKAAEKKEKQKKEKKEKKEKAVRYVTPEDRYLMKRDEEDIKYYAKKLGLKSTKLSDLKDDEDGLGGLLDGLDFLDNYGASGDEEDYSKYAASEDEELSEEGEGEEDDEDHNEDVEESEAEDDNSETHEIIENPFSDDDEINSSDFDSDEDGEFDEDEEEGDVMRPAPKENPYVAPVSATTKYVPPALRQKFQTSQDSEQILKIKRSIKGPLNKLSEANIMTIVNDINAVYMENPRQLVTECLTSLVLESLVQQSVLLDTFVILHAALIGSIYRLQGVEVGAYFIQTLVEKYERFYKNGETKAASNLLSLLTSCYSFQLISCKLLYNLISTLIEDINEMNSELLLRIVRNAGQQMRVDDPNSLKEIIMTLHKNVSGKETNARTKFLVETITNLKNNKSKINNEAAHSLIIRMKKILGGINGNKFHEPLQVSLEDIHNVETKGKWWLVGAAWKGKDSTKEEPLVDKEQLNDILDTAEPNWMELARAQRMNTDVRRAIFISIMSSNDYLEAFTKLDKLRLKRSQEREIPKILLHCVSIEKAYNPYYGLLANKLCSSHGLRKTLQFCFWDVIKEVEGDDDDEDDSDEEGGKDYFKRLNSNMIEEDDDFKLRRLVNLGKFFGNLIAEGSLPLHSLKNVNFIALNSDASLFIEVLMISFFDSIGKKSEVASFGNGSKKAKASDLKFQDTLLIERLAKCQQQRPLLRGLQYFLQEKVRPSDIINGKKQKRRVEWGVDSTCDIVDEFLKSGE